ncbi:MAG TPA: hypothetical protein VFS67_34850 [Polyangiaceae bacterium]|nr:hypothetical protein [Polyangiaceae bacterium]
MLLQGSAGKPPHCLPGARRGPARLQRWAAGVAGGALALALATPCRARSMDPALSRLMLDPSCAALDAPACAPDRALYYKLVSQLGFALAPSAPHEARTTGLSGFQLSLLGAFTAIDAGADYWRRGTRGASDRAPAIDGSGFEQNAEPDGWLQLYSLEARKGFGFGVEAAGSLGIMPNTSLIEWGADLRIALLEGLRHGVWRYLPDTSIGIGLRRATGLSDLDLGVLALDARVSEPLVGADGFIVTPWLGYQFARIDAESTLVDLTPGRDALGECGYVGPNLPGTPGSSASVSPSPSAAPGGALDGAPVCRDGSAADFANSVAFGDADVLRHRVLLGLSYRRELLRLGAELITDLVHPDAAQSDANVARALRCDSAGECRPSPRQWTLAIQVGAAF